MEKKAGECFVAGRLGGRNDVHLTSGWIVVLSTKQMVSTANPLCFSVTWILQSLHTATMVWRASSLDQSLQLFLETKNLEYSLCVWSRASAPGESCWWTSLNCSESGNGGKSHSFSGIFSVVSPCLHLLLVSSHPRLFQPDLPVLGETTSINECNDFSISYSSSWTNA